MWRLRALRYEVAGQPATTVCTSSAAHAQARGGDLAAVNDDERAPTGSAGARSSSGGDRLAEGGGSEPPSVLPLNIGVRQQPRRRCWAVPADLGPIRGQRRAPGQPLAAVGWKLLRPHPRYRDPTDQCSDVDRARGHRAFSQLMMQYRVLSRSSRRPGTADPDPLAYPSGVSKRAPQRARASTSRCRSTWFTAKGTCRPRPVRSSWPGSVKGRWCSPWMVPIQVERLYADDEQLDRHPIRLVAIRSTAPSRATAT